MNTHASLPVRSPFLPSHNQTARSAHPTTSVTPSSNEWRTALRKWGTSSPQSPLSPHQGASPLFPRANDLRSASALPHPAPTSPTAAKTNNELEAKKHALFVTAQNFEALLVYQMFKAMHKNLAGDKLLGENQATKLFKDFLNNERSLLAVKNSNPHNGLAKTIYEQYVKHI